MGEMVSDDLSLYRDAIKSAEENGGKDLAGSSVLHIACQFGMYDEVKKYLDQGVDVNQKNNFKKTPAHLACYAKQPKILELLVNSGADINIQDDFGNTLIHVCAAVGDTEMAKYLIEKGADYAGIFGISTLIQFRRKGLAKFTSNFLASYAKNLGCKWIALNSTPDGEHIYKNIGFQVEAEEMIFIPEKYL